jgi:hypothetical protein
MIAGNPVIAIRRYRLRGVVAAITAVGVLAACAAPGTTPSVEPTQRPSLSAASSVVPSAAPSLATSCLDEPLPVSPGLVSGSFAEVVTNDLVLRSAPRIADDSRLIGELNAPQRVHVIAGPVEANGYEWWSVMSEGGSFDDRGWVAAAGKDGEEWLRALPSWPGTWTVVARRDVLGAIPAYERSATGSDGRIYVFGGTDGAALEPVPLPMASAFDPTTCGWVDLAAMPVAHEGLHGAELQDGSFTPSHPRSTRAVRDQRRPFISCSTQPRTPGSSSTMCRPW